jgi:hypothetical protein
MHSRDCLLAVIRLAMLIVAVSGLTDAALAQSLNLEGQSGGVATPFAYTLASRPNGISLPSASFHLLSGGDVVGTHFQVSLAVGFLNRAEVGFTRSAVSEGSSQPFSNLFDRGFGILQGKVALIHEGDCAKNMPAVSAGFVTRYQRKHIEGGLGTATQNGDIYVTATKTIGPIEQAHLVLNGGLKATNASIMGLAGNSPSWALCGFAFAGVKVGGAVLIGAEYVQQPEEIEEFDGTDVPGVVTLLARVTPGAEARLAVEAGMISLGDEIGPGLDVEADNRFFFGAGYRF